MAVNLDCAGLAGDNTIFIDVSLYDDTFISLNFYIFRYISVYLQLPVKINVLVNGFYFKCLSLSTLVILRHFNI